MKTADDIISSLKERVEQGKIIGKEDWLEEAFALNTLVLDEANRQFELEEEVAKKRREIYHAQEKKNVAAVEIEVQARPEYRMARFQEEKVRQIKRYIRIAEKQSDLL